MRLKFYQFPLDKILKQVFLVCFFIACTGVSYTASAQCTSNNQDGSSPITADADGTGVSWSENANSYVRATSVVNGGVYTLSSSTSSDYFTVRTGSSTGGTVVANGTSSLTFTATNTTIYIIVSRNSGCSTNSSNRTITLYAAPNITSTSSSACIGSTFTITGTNFSGVTSVSVNGTNAPTFTINSATSITVTVPTGATTGKVTVTGPGGSDISSSNITINAAPVNKTVSGTATICSGSSTNISVASSATGTTYQLRNNADNSLVGSAVTGTGGTITLPTGALTATTTFNVLATTVSTGCTAQMTNTITITVTSINATATNSSQSICSGTSFTTMTLGTSPTVSGTTFAWSRDNTTTVTGGANSGTGNITGATLTNTTNSAITVTYTITPTGPSPAFCAGAPITATVVVKPKPVGSAVNDSVCSGTATAIDLNSTVSGTTYTWTATASSGTISGGANCTSGCAGTIAQTLTSTAGGVEKYTVNLTANGCAGTAFTVNAIVLPLPSNKTVNGTATICQGNNSNITLNGSSSGFYYQLRNDADNSYIGSAVVGTGGTISMPTGALNATTSFNVLALNGATGCSKEMSNVRTVTVNQLPMATVTNGSQSICTGSAFTSMVLGTSPTLSGTTFTWSRDNTSVVTGGATSGTTSTISGATLTNNTSSPVTVTYTIIPTGPSSTYCVGNPITATIVVSPLPTTYTVSGSATICPGTSANITLSNSQVGVNYQLRNNTGNVAVGSPVAGTGGSITLPTGSVSTTTTYNVLATNATSGCSQQMSGTATITMNTAPANNAGANRGICIGGNTTLGATSTAGRTYAWSPATGLSSTTISNPLCTATVTTVYTLVETITATGCTASNNVTVTVNPLPTPTTGNDVAICSGSSTTLGTLSISGHTYNWSPGTGLSSSTVANPTCSATSNTTYTLTETISSTGCSASASVNVSVNPKPDDNAGADQSLCTGYGSTSIGANSIAGHTYSWSPSTNLSNSTIANPTTNTTVTRTYTLVETITATGCTASNTVTITINPVIASNTITASQSVCSGSAPASLTGSTPTGGNGTYTYLWESSTTSATTGFGPADGTNNGKNYSPSAINQQTWYRRTVTSGGCSSTSSTVQMTIKPLPTVTLTTNYCGTNGVVTVTSNSQSGYLWSTGATTQSITVDEAGIYVITATGANGCSAVNTATVAVELVTNGNFSAGNTGFTSAYGYTSAQPNGLYPEGLYAVGPNANSYHDLFYGTDHTTGTGNFMIVNGSTSSTPTTIWSQTITVQPNTDYYFSAWAVSMNQVPPYAQLQFQVNGEQIGTVATLLPGASSTSGPFGWTRFYGTWNSGAVTTVTLSIIDLQTAAGGNDFGLDDISCSTLAPLTFTVAPTAVPNLVCVGDPINLHTNLTGGSAPFTYTWSGPNSFSSSASDPTIGTSTLAMGGSYNVTVVNAYGCSATATTSVTVGSYPTNLTATASPTAICSGSSANIQIASSQSGVNYQLRNNADNSLVGSAVSGTGGTINLSTGTLSSTTTFNVLATNSTTGCSIQLTSTPTVTINTTPVLHITNQAACSGTVNLTAAAVTAGSTGGGTLTYWTNSTATTSLSTPSSVGSGTYYIKSTVGSCYDIEPVTVTISTTPVATFSYTGSPYCQTASNPSPTFSGGGQPGTFSSTSGLVFVSTSTGQINLAASTPGTYTVTNTITPSGACSPVSRTSSVTITALPSAAFSYSSNDLCQNAGANNPSPVLASGATLGTFSSSYGLNFVSTSTGQINIGNSTPGNYAVTNTVAATGGCSAVSSRIYIDINAYTFTSSITDSVSPSTICSGQSAQIGITAPSYRSAILKEGFNGTVNNWTTTNTSSGGTPANAIWALKADSTLYSGTYFSSNDQSQFYMSNSASQGSGGTTATILTSPAMSSVGYTSLALDFFQYFRYNSGETAKVQVSINGIAWTDVATYSSTQGTSTIFTNSVVDLSAYINQPTLYVRFKYDATNDYYWAIDNISVTGYTSNYTYNWASTPTGFTSTTQNPSVSPTVSSAYNVSVTNSYGCISVPTALNVSVNPAPNNLTPTTPASICTGSSTNINLNNSQSGVTYQLRDNTNASVGSSVSGTGGSISFPTPTLTASKTYNVYATINSTGCSKQMTDTVTVTVAPLQTVTPGSTLSACQSSTPGDIVLSGASIGGSATTAAWSINGGTGGTLTSNSQTTTPGSVAFTPAADYSGTVTLTLTTANGTCPSVSDTRTININAKPAASVSVNTPVCTSGSLNFVGSPAGMSSYAWSGPVSFSSSSQSPSRSSLTTGMSGTYNLTVTDGNGCSATASTAATVISGTAGLWIGGISSDWSDANNWCSGVPTASTNVTIPAGTTFPPVISANAFAHNINVNAGASLSITSGGYLKLYGDLTLAGTYNHTAGTLELTGTLQQTIPAITTYNVVINNNHNVTLGGDLTVTGGLTLTDGLVVTGSYQVDMRDTTISKLSTGSTSSYIYGTLKRAVGDTGTYNFPVGSNTHYQLATVQLTANQRKSQGGIDSLTAFFTRGFGSCSHLPGSAPINVNGTQITSLLDGGYWTIHPDTTAYTGVQYNVTLQERGWDDDVENAANMAVVKRPACGSDWQSIGTHNNSTQSLNNGVAKAVRSQLTSFSDFGIGFSGGFALPVEMMYLEAEAISNKYIEVRWATALEINNLGFRVERSTNGSNWDSIGWVAGHNNTTQEIAYTYNDNDVVPNQRYYYRLKQIDNNADFKYTDIVTAKITSESTVTVADFIPNPTQGGTSINISSLTDETVKITAYNMIGQSLFTQHFNVTSGNTNVLNLDLNKLPAGTYQVAIETSNGIVTKKLVVAH